MKNLIFRTLRLCKYKSVYRRAMRHIDKGKKHIEKGRMLLGKLKALVNQINEEREVDE